MKGGEVLRGMETRRVPLDVFADAWLGAEEHLPDGKNLLFERVIKRREKGLNVLRPGRIAFRWFCAGGFRGHGTPCGGIKRAMRLLLSGCVTALDVSGGIALHSTDRARLHLLKRYVVIF
jgi:hypothetical protein